MINAQLTSCHQQESISNQKLIEILWKYSPHLGINPKNILDNLGGANTGNSSDLQTLISHVEGMLSKLVHSYQLHTAKIKYPTLSGNGQNEQNREIGENRDHRENGENGGSGKEGMVSGEDVRTRRRAGRRSASRDRQRQPSCGSSELEGDGDDIHASPSPDDDSLRDKGRHSTHRTHNTHRTHGKNSEHSTHTAHSTNKMPKAQKTPTAPTAREAHTGRMYKSNHREMNDAGDILFRGETSDETPSSSSSSSLLHRVRNSGEVLREEKSRDNGARSKQGADSGGSSASRYKRSQLLNNDILNDENRSENDIDGSASAFVEHLKERRRSKGSPVHASDTTNTTRDIRDTRNTRKNIPSKIKSDSDSRNQQT